HVPAGAGRLRHRHPARPAHRRRLRRRARLAAARGHDCLGAARAGGGVRRVPDCQPQVGARTASHRLAGESDLRTWFFSVSTLVALETACCAWAAAGVGTRHFADRHRNRDPGTLFPIDHQGSISWTYSFPGSSALVTGAASGIGEAVAHLLAANGVSVVVSDLKADAVRRVVDAIVADGGRAVGNVCDVADAAQVEAAVACAIEHFGALHLAVNNAGIGGTARPAGELPAADWQRVIDINLSGVAHGLRYQIPAILAAGGGAIVNMSSILGLVGDANAPAYVAAKH